jgi:lipopolysaccharide transport system permease protein
MLVFRLQNILKFSFYITWCEIRDGFSRNRLGTLWNSLGHFAAVGLLGVFFGSILKSDVGSYENYLSFLGMGLFVWIFISQSINESCSLFVTNASALRHTSQPFFAFILKPVLKNLLIFIQNIVLGIVIYFFATDGIEIKFLPLCIGILIVFGVVLSLCSILAIACIRFRDLPQLVSWIIHVSFFLTPIIWMEHFLGRFIYLVELNPAYYLISIVRQPTLGTTPDSILWLTSIFMLVVGASLATYIYSRTVHKLPYWL